MANSWREELAWAAGFVDGEGCFTTNGQWARAPRLKVGQSTLPLLERMQALFPYARIHTSPHRLPSRPDEEDRFKPFSYLDVNGFEKTQAALAQMWPWLGEQKREDAKRVLARHLSWPRKRALANRKEG